MSIAKNGQQPQSIWYSRSAVPTPLGIAAQRGSLHEEFVDSGLALLSVQEQAEPALRSAHTDHHLSNCFRQGGSVPALWARSEGIDTRVIGLTWTDEFQVLLALSDSGIRHAKDLRGLRLGLPLRADEKIDMARATALRGYLNVFEHNGLNYRDVEFVDVPAWPKEVPSAEQSAAFLDLPAGHLSNRDYIADVNALLRRKVDVIYVKGVRGVEVARLLADRAIVVVDIGGNPDTRIRSNNATPRPLTVNAATLRDYPEIATRLLRRVVDVGPWAAAHPSEALAALARETGAREEWVSYAYGIDLHEHLYTDLSERSIVALEEFKNFLFQWGFIQNNFSIRDWIDAAPLAAVSSHTLRKSA
ncbi:MAG TPA: ABC transporter substrate-binding protein [Spongiibacteraceae bacterium]|nr:ABC transporter substrate-binding protein [Spongiibacteraceae bacterium]